MAIALMFRAGRLQLDDGRLLPKADPGFLRIMEELDGTLRLQWVKRNKASMVGDAKMDVPVAIGLAEVARIGPAASRAFKIFGSLHATDIAFFWMQERKPQEDEFLLRRLKDTLAGVGLGVSPETASLLPPLSHSTLRDPSEAGQVHEEPHTPSAEPKDLSESAPEAASAPSTQIASHPQSSAAIVPLTPMSYRQAAASGVTGRATVSAADLASILSGIGGSGSVGGSSHGAQREAALALGEMRRRAAMGPSLNEVLSPDVTIPLAMEPGVLDLLSEQMPPEHRSQTELRALLESPQLRRQIGLLHHGISSGALNLQHFGLQAQGFSTIDFLKSIQDKYGKPPAGDGT